MTHAANIFGPYFPGHISTHFSKDEPGQAEAFPSFFFSFSDTVVLLEDFPLVEEADFLLDGAGFDLLGLLLLFFLLPDLFCFDGFDFLEMDGLLPLLLFLLALVFLGAG